MIEFSITGNSLIRRDTRLVVADLVLVTEGKGSIQETVGDDASEFFMLKWIDDFCGVVGIYVHLRRSVNIINELVYQLLCYESKTIASNT
jgi:hypothetical protein